MGRCEGLIASSSVDLITQRWGVCHISGCQLSQLQDGVVVAFYHAASRHGIINDSWSQDCIRHVTCYSFAASAKLLTR
jgi:hypothetical protein